jgi:hypothetical protein
MCCCIVAGTTAAEDPAFTAAVATLAAGAAAAAATAAQCTEFPTVCFSMVVNYACKIFIKRSTNLKAFTALVSFMYPSPYPHPPLMQGTLT